MALSRSGAAASRKSSLVKSTPGIASMSRMSIATTRPFAPTRLRRHLAPAAGRGAQIEHARAGFEEMVLVVDLGELERGARAQPLALRLGDIGIVELALQPERGRQRTLLGGLDPHLQRALATPPLSPRVSHGAALRMVPRAILAHHLHQHAFAQAAVGDAQPRAWEGAADRLQDGAAGQHQVGALGADARIGDAILVAHGEQPLDHAGRPASSSIQQPSTRRRS